MEFIEVSSSMISKIFYNQKTNCLFVVFKNGSIYSYLDVPKFLYEELLSARSIGKFFSEYIKKAFTFVKLSEEPE
jgi:hypothetical protein